ncbi:hypothetical protein [Amycolatopsis minnesotensis]
MTPRTHDGALAHLTHGGRWRTPPELADPGRKSTVDLVRPRAPRLHS